MKNCLINLILAGILSTILLACTSQLHINTLRPADVSVSNEQWKVVVVNRFTPALHAFDREKKVDVYIHGAQQAFLGAIEAIAQDSTYQLVHTDTAGYKHGQVLEPLHAAQVQDIYQQYPHHLILSLENFEVFMNRETVREESEDGSVTKTAHFTLVSKAHWSLYDSTGMLVDQVTLREEQLYQSREVISGLLAVGPAIGNAGNAVNALAWETGYDYWKRLYPQPVSYFRPYYSQQKLEEAAAYMAREDWPAAIALLKPMAESNAKRSARAAYNLAVVYEAMGDMNEARYWAQQAKQKNNRLALYQYQNF